MSSQFQPHYDSFPSNSLHPTSTSTPAAFLTRARATVMATRRPWSQLIDRHSFSRPDPFFGVATVRIKRNLYYFRVNYAMIVLVILFLSLLWHPISMIVFLIVFVAWFLLYFFRDQPFVIFNRQVDDRFILGILGIITFLSLIFTNVWLNVLISVLIGAFVVVLHALPLEELKICILMKEMVVIMACFPSLAAPPPEVATPAFNSLELDR